MLSKAVVFNLFCTATHRGEFSFSGP